MLFDDRNKTPIFEVKNEIIQANNIKAILEDTL